MSLNRKIIFVGLCCCLICVLIKNSPSFTCMNLYLHAVHGYFKTSFFCHFYTPPLQTRAFLLIELIQYSLYELQTKSFTFIHKHTLLPLETSYNYLAV